MKINELAKMTQINAETIRMYRKMGFLHPEQQTNGYYEYSIADFSSLVYLRKMREYGMSLTDISNYENSAKPTDLVQMLEEEEKTIKQQMEVLKERQRFIRFEKRHVIESIETGEESVQVMQSIDDKLDYYGEDVIMNALQQLDARSIYLTTTSCLRIDREVLNGKIEDHEIRMEAGIGLYRFMIERKHLTVPEHAVIVPNGICISQMVSLRNCEKINILQLAPMMAYAKKNHHTFLSDTTGYLARIRHDEQGVIFDFRIRACIEKNHVEDASAA
jgi:DNA-binding transcriptional MerR regulator